MSRIRGTFERLAASGRKGFVPFIPAGYPDQKSTLSLIKATVRGGADIIEIGVPFSDSLADGPTVQQAYNVGVSEGMTLDRVLALVREARTRIDTPIVLMCAYNLIHDAGLSRFVADCATSGVDGVIVPDLSFEESPQLRRGLSRGGVDLISLIAPTTPLARARRIARGSSGFLYVISRIGVTGVRQEFSQDSLEILEELKNKTDIPLVLGFGISTPGQAVEAARNADGVVVGSAIIREIDNGGRVSIRVATLVKDFRRTLDQAYGTRALS